MQLVGMQCIKYVYLITYAPPCFSKLSGHEFLWYILLYRHFHNRQVEFISVPDKDDGCQEAVEKRTRSGGDEPLYRAKSSNNPQNFRRSDITDTHFQCGAESSNQLH